MLRPRAFTLPRLLVVLYAGGALVYSGVLVQMSARRGPGELAGWLAACTAIALLTLVRPQLGPLAAGFAAFVLGFVRTWRHGTNLDLGLGLILLSLGLWLLARTRRQQVGWTSDWTGLLLLLTAAAATVSLAFVAARIRGFAPAPGFAYHVYRFNLAGLGSEEALARAVIGAASAFSWFGLREYGLVFRPARRPLALAVLAAVLGNALALYVQQRVDPAFLHPVGAPWMDRLNGLTSFCYALGDGLLALYLLLPVWGARRGPWTTVTVAVLLLMLYGVVASGSRTALLVVAGAAMLWSLLDAARRARRGEPRLALAAAALAAALVLALAVAYVLTPPGHSTPLARLKLGIESEGLAGHVFATRLSAYPLVLRVIVAYPLSGLGAGMYQPEVDKQRALLAPWLRTDPYLLTSHAPNQLLNAAAELGLPALAALVAALWTASRRSFAARADPRAADLAVAVCLLAAAWQLGPTLYNSEALVFQWLLLGLAAARHEPSAELAAPPRTTLALVAGGLLLATLGQLAARPRLAVDAQWRALRWRMNIAMQPAQTDGQWTGAEATFTVDAAARTVRVRWHAGDAADVSYRPEVSFYVDGQLVERSVALPGRIRESALPLPPVAGLKRISVRVVPPFIPARTIGGNDERALGVFLHSVTSETAPAATP